MNTDKILIGILAGFAAGAVVGILFAPDKGSNTRKKITEKGNAVASDLESKYSNLKSEVSKTIDRVKNEYAQVMQDGQELAEDLSQVKANHGMDGMSKSYSGKTK
jgi:gas vesicle protein